jgi:hypothetical protein
MTQHDQKRKAAPYPSVVTASVLVLAGALAGCQSEEAVFEAPILELLVKPTSIKDRGQEADVQILARDVYDQPGRGDVVLEVPPQRGRFENGESTITVQLDSSGTAWAAYHCDINVDEECFGTVTVTASWKDVKASAGTEPTTATRNVSIEGCGRPNPGNPSIVRRCAPAAASECTGEADSFLSEAGVEVQRLNGTSGNGFDDDCDGLVDEGCSCPGNGQTKECFLVPATQVAADTKLPVNWCATNSKGSVDCIGEQQTVWSGVCRGAQPPAENDSCAEGDFNCDGLQSNNALAGCRCAAEVQCPTAPITKAPFPDPRNLAPLDGTQWIIDPAKRALATNWTWTVVGGDCDNVLPFPTFGLFKAKETTAGGSRIGARKPVAFDASQNPPRYVERTQSSLAGLRASTGNGLAGGVVFPAFGLSGDYVVQGEFDLNGTHFVCTQKVEVRAPGVRAELCWDSVGTDDVDLHFARLQDVTCTSNGWDGTCSNQDCYYANESPNWGYASSPDSACRGWSSRRTGACTNPRLDADNVSCSRTISDPAAGNFCGPENINIDNPKDGDRFVVGVNYFTGRGTPPRSHPHVNIYCNGKRVLSAGYNPVTGQVNFPVLLKSGGDSSGDFWTVATVQTTVDTSGNLVSCNVETIPSRHADPTRDGPSPTGTGADFCVDSTTNATPAPNTFNYSSHRFVDSNSSQGLAAGAIPQTREQWCKH